MTQANKMKREMSAAHTKYQFMRILGGLNGFFMNLYMSQFNMRLNTRNICRVINCYAQLQNSKPFMKLHFSLGTFGILSKNIKKFIKLRNDPKASKSQRNFRISIKCAERKIRSIAQSLYGCLLNFLCNSIMHPITMQIVPIKNLSVQNISFPY